MAKRKSNRYFYVKDVDCTICVEYGKSKRDVMDYIDEMIENLQYDGYDYRDDAFSILYEDGSEDYIDNMYDGHKIKKQHIASIVYSNPCTYLVVGNISINEWGVVSPSFEEEIADTNIKEVDNWDYSEL